jgi:hypothetical protein
MARKRPLTPHKERCGAKPKAGVNKYGPRRTWPCRRYPLKGKKRCRSHGGHNRPHQPGDRVNVGPMLAAKNARVALYKSLGLKWFGGSGPGGRDRSTILAKRVIRNRMAEIKEHLPAHALNGPIEKLTLAEANLRVAYKGLLRLDEIVSIKIPRDFEAVRDGIKVYRLVGDMAVASNKLFATMGESAAAQQRDRALTDLLEQIAAEREVKME